MITRPLTISTQTATILDWLRTHAKGAFLCADSRQLKTGEVFIALAGKHHDGRAYIDHAVAAGAVAIVCEANDFVLPKILSTPNAPPYLRVKDLASELVKVTPLYYDQPDRDMRVIAVTGTNGKTTCAHWIAQTFAQISGAALMIGTMGIRQYNNAGIKAAINPPASAQDEYETGYTTPDSVTLFRALAQAKRDHVTTVAIEASSIGLVEQRMAGLHIDVAIFTNLTQDHLDYHGNMLAYEAAKRTLFDTPNLQTAVVNLDDPAGWRILAHIEKKSSFIKVIGYTQNHDISQQFIAQYPQHSVVAARIKQQDGVSTRVDVAARHFGEDFKNQVHLPILGSFNVSNMLAVIAALFDAKVKWGKILEVIKDVGAVPGRMQIAAHAPLVLVDFAHTPDALEKVLTTLRPIATERKGKLWCVFGCGGNRDPLKRPLMGQVARLADEIVLTSDNPRDEEPAHIISQIKNGLTDRIAHIHVDRAEAIKHSINLCAEQDVVLIAGKGHERTQEIRGIKKPFEDMIHAQLALKSRAFSQQFLSGPNDVGVIS